MKYKIDKSTNIQSFLYCLFTILFLMLALSVITSSNSYKIETWQDYATYDFEQEITIDDDGNEVITNLISTPEQLAGYFNLQSNSGVYAEDFTNYFNSSNSFKLSSNIDLGRRPWQPKPNSNNLDGNFFTISNLYVAYDDTYVGFISSNSKTIKDLFFANVDVTNTKSNGAATGTGTVCGYNSGTIDNVTVLNGTVTGSSYNNSNEDRRAGGICGYNAGTITHCINHATVNRGKFLGGIAGVSKKKIENCYNYGTISNPLENQWPRLGGIVAENESGASISLCANWGSVSGYYSKSGTSPTVSDIRIGGIVGHSSVAVSKCGNYGSVSGGYYYTNSTIYVNVSYAGGVVGYCTTTITNCYNSGSVYAYAKDSSSTFASGSLSNELVWGASQAVGQQTWSNGDSYAIKISSDVKAYAGGIAGKASSVSNCYNRSSTVSGGRKKIHVDYHDSYTDRTWILFIPIDDKYSVTATVDYTEMEYSDAICPDCEQSNIVNCFYINKSSQKNNNETRVHVKVTGTNAYDKYLDVINKNETHAYGSSWPYCSFSLTSSLSGVTHYGNLDGLYISMSFYRHTPWDSSHMYKFTQDVIEKGVKVTSDELKDSIVNSLGSAWEVNSYENNEYPYIKDMYW